MVYIQVNFMKIVKKKTTTCTCTFITKTPHGVLVIWAS